MPTYGQITTDLKEIYDALASQVATVSGVAADHIFLSLDANDDPTERPPGDRFIVVRFVGFVPVGDVIRGAGNNLPNFRGKLTVEAYARLHTDQDMRSHNLITDASAGLLAIWLAVLGSLHQFSPVRATDTGKSLLTEPIKAVGVEFPRKKMARGWGCVTSTWDLSFLHRLS